MQPNNYIKIRSFWMVAIGSLFLLVSCGSYQYVGYDNDGIYGPQGVVYEEEPNNVTTDAGSASYYSTYFREKEQQYNYITEEGDEVFTDVDSYQGDYDQQPLDSLNYKPGYAGWGYNNPSQISINVINMRPYYGFGYGWYNPWYYDTSAWGYGYGYYPYYRYYGPSWYWNSPYWGIGGGFGYWHPHYYGNAFYNGYYNYTYYRNNVAYQSGRRGHYSSDASGLYRNYNSSAMNRRSSVTARETGNNIQNRRSTNRTINRLDPNSRENSYGIRSSRSTTTNRNNSVRSYDNYRRSTSQSRTMRNSYPTRSSNNGSINRRSSSPTPSVQRSAPSSRSSGSSMSRSSSSSRGSSGGRRGNNI